MNAIGNGEWAERKRLMRVLGCGAGLYLSQGCFSGAFVTSSFSFAVSYLEPILTVL